MITADEGYHHASELACTYTPAPPRSDHGGERQRPQNWET
jgi:hypothetical protein